jgi:hypothetical protein
VATQGDLSDPGAVLADEEILGAGLELAEPACVVLGCVLHFVPPDTARRTIAAFTGAMVPGSYLIISVGFDGSPAPDGDFADTYNARGDQRAVQRVGSHTSRRRRRCGVAP